MERQFTATAYIIDQEKVLLIYHKKLQKWLPPGGHIDLNETPPEAAKREALEETGIEIELVPQENLWIEHFNAKSFERPFMCLLENIPLYKDQPAHQHMDMIYVGRPISGKVTLNTRETDGVRWFTIDEINLLKGDEEIFEETRSSIHTVFSALFTPSLESSVTGRRPSATQEAGENEAASEKAVTEEVNMARKSMRKNRRFNH